MSDALIIYHLERKKKCVCVCVSNLIMLNSNFHVGCTSVNNPVDGSIGIGKCQRVISEEAQVFRTIALK